MDFADLLNLSKKQEEKQEEKKEESTKSAATDKAAKSEEKQGGGEMLGAILPHLLKGNSGANELMPLLAMLGGGEPDYGSLLNMLIKQNKEKKQVEIKQEEKKHKSMFDDYTRLE